MILMLAFAATVLFFFGGHFLWSAFTHHGPGSVMYGGYNDATGSDADFTWDSIPESSYRRHCLLSAGIFLFLGVVTACETTRRWRSKPPANGA